MLGKNIEQINHARLAGKEGLWRITVKNNQIAAIEPQPQSDFHPQGLGCTRWIGSRSFC